MRACLLLRHTQHYRADVFAAALRWHGYQVDTRHQRNPQPNDLLVIWNRNRSLDPIAQKYEAAGARVLVVENGYLDRLNGQKYYALALGGHNGSGRWFVGDEPRFEVPEQPWRKDGRQVLVLPQRGIGQPGVAMPSTWLQHIRRKLEKITDRPVLVRQHPGHRRLDDPLVFPDIWCCVTWGSGAGIKALQAGIPVFHELGCWIGSAAAARLDDSVEHCHTPERAALWTRITWAQWTLEEIGSGEAFDRLLNEKDRCLFRPGQPSLAADRPGDGPRDRLAGGPCRAPLVA